MIRCPICKTLLNEPNVEDKTGYTAFYHCKKCDRFFTWEETEETLNSCPKCKAKLEGNPKFCPECGNKLV